MFQEGMTGIRLNLSHGDLRDHSRWLELFWQAADQCSRTLESLIDLRGPELLPFADHVVIARGDLGNAMPLWELPGVQKRISRMCRETGKSFMVVTQMLDSMHERAVPTRAEVSDIYNAVCDGAAALMLTGETAVGRFPAEVMKYLVRTGEAARKDLGVLG